VEDYPEFGGDFQRYRGKISDHVPVKLEIRWGGNRMASTEI